MKKLSVLFATLLVVALSVTSCKKAEQKVEPDNPDTTTVVVGQYGCIVLKLKENEDEVVELKLEVREPYGDLLNGGIHTEIDIKKIYNHVKLMYKLAYDAAIPATIKLFFDREMVYRDLV